MEIIFFNIGDYLFDLKAALHPHVCQFSEHVSYQNLRDYREYKPPILGHVEEPQVLFYRMQDAPAAHEVSRHIANDFGQVRRVAICDDYQQGIQAVGNGSDYALLWPVKESSIERCCNFMRQQCGR